MKSLRILNKGKLRMAVVLLILVPAVTANAQHQNPPSQQAGDTTHIQQGLMNCEPVEKYDDEIRAEEITPAVSSEIFETYPGLEISKAYRAPDGSYKVNIEKGDEKVVVCYSINGELLSEENFEDTPEDW